MRNMNYECVSVERMPERRIVSRTWWTSEDIMRMCIRNDYYTCGTCDQYERMLSDVARTAPTVSRMYIIAADIVDHSNLEKYGQTRAQNIASVMYEIREAIHTTYEIDED